MWECPVLLRGHGGEEVTTLTLDRAQGEVWLDRQHASLDPTARGGRYGGAIDADIPIERVRVIVDRSIVEVFVDDQVTLTARIYPTRCDSTGIEVVGTRDSADGVDPRAWVLASIRADPAPDRSRS